MKFVTEVQPDGLVKLVIDYEKREGTHEDHLLLTPVEASLLEFSLKGIYLKAKALFKAGAGAGHSPFVKGKVAEVKRGPLPKQQFSKPMHPREHERIERENLTRTLKEDWGKAKLPKAVAQKELGRVLKAGARTDERPAARKLLTKLAPQYVGKALSKQSIKPKRRK